MEKKKHHLPKGIIFMDKITQPHMMLNSLRLAGLGHKIEYKVIVTDGKKEIDPAPWGESSHEVVCVATLWGQGEDVLKIIKSNPNVKWVHSFTAGVDRILHPEILSSGCTITNTKGVFSPALAEFAIFQMLWFEKKGTLWQQQQHDHVWNKHYVGCLYDKQVGIIGYGDIGGQCAIKAKRGFGMRVVGLKTDPTKVGNQEYRDCADEIVGFDRMDEVLATSDYIIACLPLTPQTKGIFDKAKFDKFKRSSVFLNIGRGQNVVEKDLVEALKEKKLAGAYLDVFEKEPLPEDSELWNMKNVFITPHSADYTTDTWDLTAKQYIPLIDEFVSGKTFSHNVDKTKGY